MKRKIRFIIIIMLSFFLVACSNNKDLKDVVNEVASYRNVERMTSSKTMLSSDSRDSEWMLYPKHIKGFINEFDDCDFQKIEKQDFDNLVNDGVIEKIESPIEDKEDCFEEYGRKEDYFIFLTNEKYSLRFKQKDGIREPALTIAFFTNKEGKRSIIVTNIFGDFYYLAEDNGVENKVNQYAEKLVAKFKEASKS